jgi:hypothetical protein
VKLRREHGRVHTGRGIAARYRILVLLIVRDPPATAGLLIAVGGLGGDLGSAVVGRVADKLSGTVARPVLWVPVGIRRTATGR